MIASHKTHDGFNIEVFDGGYMDYGLLLRNKDGEVVFESPCYLNFECYGSNGPNSPWDQYEWSDCLDDEADDIIFGILGE